MRIKGNGKKGRVDEDYGYKRFMVTMSFSAKEIERFDVEMKKHKFVKRAVFARWCIEKYLETYCQEHADV